MKTNYIYYVAYNELNKEIYFGKCGANCYILQNLRCSLKIKGDELAKWEYMTITELNGDIETSTDKINLYSEFYSYYKDKLYKGAGYKILNKQPQIFIDLNKALKLELDTSSKLLLNIYKELH